MKEKILIIAGTLGGGIASLFGGWDKPMIALGIVMAADYITGLIVAGVFKTYCRGGFLHDNG